jgi:hypothetical protein
VQDARELQSLDASRGAVLLAEVAAHRARTVKADRKLARDVAKWVDSALNEHKSPCNADIDVAADNEEDEEDKDERPEVYVDARSQTTK